MLQRCIEDLLFPSDAALREVCEALIAAKRHNPDRITVEKLRQVFQSNRGVAKGINGSIVAMALLWPHGEIGTVWTREDCRGFGLMGEVLDELLAKVNGTELFFFTRDDAESKPLMSWANNNGFKCIRSGDDHPGILRWASEIGVVCRLPKSIWGIEDSRLLFLRSK